MLLVTCHVTILSAIYGKDTSRGRSCRNRGPFSYSPFVATPPLTPQMDDQFASQLANLQRAASRAGGNASSTAGANNSNGRSDRDNTNRSGREYTSRGGRGGGESGEGSYSSRDNRQSSYDSSSRDRSRHQGRGRDYGYDRKRRRDQQDYHDRDGWRRVNDRTNNNGGGHHHHHRDYDGRNSRDYHRGGDRWQGNGGGGRRDNRSSNGDRRDERGGHYDNSERSSERGTGPSQEPLVELVKMVAEKHTKVCEAQPSTESKKKKRRHIALLFLTIDDLPHEHVWKEWLKSSVHNNNNSSLKEKEGEDGTPQDNEGPLVSVLCHAKFPERIKSQWLRQRHLIRLAHRDETKSEDGKTEQKQCDGKSEETTFSPPKYHSRRPEWGSVEITRGMIDLVEEGLRIGAPKGDDAASGNGQGVVVNKHTSYRRYLSTPGDALSEADATDKGDISLSITTSIQTDDDIPPVDRFIFVSESCLPVATLDEVEMALFGPKDTDSKPKTPKKNPYDKSWVNARSTPNNGYARQQQWDEIRPNDIPQNLIWKADQWMVLTRAHGEAVANIGNNYLNDRHLWPAFRKCRASDEMYFPTALSILGIIARPSGVTEVDDLSKGESCAGDQIRRRKITYCDWSMGAKNPAPFTSDDWKEVVSKARREGCLFARKFVPLSSIRGRQKEVLTNSNDGIVSTEDWTASIIFST